MAFALLLTQCTNDPKRLEFGKRCLKHPNGTVAWSYVWIVNSIGENDLEECIKKP